MANKVRVGLIGLGKQMRKHHLPYLQKREMENKDVEIAWISGYLSTGSETADKCNIKRSSAGNGEPCYKCEPGDAWRQLIKTDKVDGVIISLPNSMHGQPIRHALQCGVNVAVEKPTTTTVQECDELVRLAEANELVFVTMAQRRYENVYQTVKDIIKNGSVGTPTLLNSLFAHEYFEENNWHYSKKMSGGGALMASGYHAIDTMIWLLGHCGTPSEPVHAVSVSADWIIDHRQKRPVDDRIEIVASVRIILNNGCIFNTTASFANPEGSLDENFKLYGTSGAVRIIRDRFQKTDNSAAGLSFQKIAGETEIIDTSKWKGMETAPIDDFVNAVLEKKENRNWSVLSPAKDSIETLRIIEAAYESARQGGKAIAIRRRMQIESPQAVKAVHHIAVQTSDLDKALHFYCDILGAELLKRRRFKKRHMAWLEIGDVKIELFSKREGDTLTEWDDCYSGPVHIAFGVEDFDVFLDGALQRGACFHPSHPQPFVPPVPGAGKIAYLLGPDGEEVEIRGILDLS